ncbi:MAG: PCRF domain-containing protein, partial [Gammaproteobacteria bacterium]|nr:PCRF domain-containing protein [Gammaproteobacteria bacterium]
MLIFKCVSKLSGGIFDVDVKAERLEEITRELEDPMVWNIPEKAQALGKERATLNHVITEIHQIQNSLNDA